MPSNGNEGGYQSVMKGLLRVIAAYEDIEDEGNVDGKCPGVQGEFKLISVIDAVIRIGQFDRSREGYDSIRSCGLRIVVHRYGC